MRKVTALGMDTITEKSGHTVTPMAVSVCTTPAAPSPIPVPYPVVASSTEGIGDAAMRTKINGAAVATVGSVLKTCHGNEPGTLKEVVSLNTAGPVFLMLGSAGPAAVGALPGRDERAGELWRRRGADPADRCARADNRAQFGNDAAGEMLARFFVIEAVAGTRAMLAAALGAVGYRAATPDLIRALSDESPSVRGSAAWSLGRLQARESLAPLQAAISRETSDYAIQRMEEAIALVSRSTRGG